MSVPSIGIRIYMASARSTPVGRARTNLEPMSRHAMQYTRLPDQSADYIQRREELRVAEIELMRHAERVAEMRRRLPPGPDGPGLRLPRGTSRPRRGR
jgi:hypothetical protein